MKSTEINLIYCDYLIFILLSSNIHIPSINGSIDNQQVAHLACLLGRTRLVIQVTESVLDEMDLMKYYTKDPNKNTIKIYAYVSDIKALRTIWITA
jgi:hypothetical protein